MRNKVSLKKKEVDPIILSMFYNFFCLKKLICTHVDVEVIAPWTLLFSVHNNCSTQIS